MDVWNYILGYRNTLKSVFETWVVHIPFKCLKIFCLQGTCFVECPASLNTGMWDTGHVSNTS